MVKRYSVNDTYPVTTGWVLGDQMENSPLVPGTSASFHRLLSVDISGFMFGRPA